MKDAKKIAELFLTLVQHSRQETILLLPSIEAFHRERTIGVNAAMRDACARGVSVRLLSPLDSGVEDDLVALNSELRGTSGINFRAVLPPRLRTRSLS
jgi:hypothetical protein